MSTPRPARFTPYEWIFGAPAFEDGIFPAIVEEARARGHDVGDPGRFVLLAAVGRLLRALAPAPADDPGGDAVRSFGGLAFQALHFWRAGRRLYTLDEDAMRGVLGPYPTVGEWALRTPAPAGYVQLPRNRVWSTVAEDLPPEPVDGFHWVGGDSPSSRRLDLLVCTGLRPGRPGLGVLEAAVPLPAPPPGHWADAAAREDGPDFANVLPGGELDGLFALTTQAEMLKLASRVFHLAATSDGTPAPPGADADGVEANVLPPSRLPSIALRPTLERRTTRP
jgi:hypothetical protein